jgi:DNA-3-methyladenine glycosylase
VTRSQVPNIRAAVAAGTAEDFEGSTIDVARRLIGATLERVIPRGEPDAGTLVSGRIVETEAYLPNVDPACHGYRGPTKRSAPIFGRPGSAYVYLIYGMYFCLNVVTEPPGVGAAVLLRAIEPLAGLDAMRRRRRAGTPEARFACGPGNLCRAMAIDLQCNGVDLRIDPRLHIIIGGASPPKRIGVTSRVGLSSAADWPLRFYDPDSHSVSRPPPKPKNR